MMIKNFVWLTLCLVLFCGWTKEYTSEWLKERRQAIEKLEEMVNKFPDNYYFVVYFKDNDEQVIPVSGETLELSKQIRGDIYDDSKTNVRAID